MSKANTTFISVPTEEELKKKSFAEIPFYSFFEHNNLLWMRAGRNKAVGFRGDHRPSLTMGKNDMVIPVKEMRIEPYTEKPE